MWMIVEVKVNFKFLRSIEDRSIMKMRCVHVYILCGKLVTVNSAAIMDICRSENS